MRITFVYLSAALARGKTQETTSGGVEHFIQICKHLSEEDLEAEVLTNPAGAHLLKSRGVRATIHIVSKEFLYGLLYRSYPGVALLYILTSFGAILSLMRFRSKAQIVCTVTSDLPDIVAAFMVQRLSHLKVRPVAYIHGPLLGGPLSRQYHPFLASFLGRVQQELILSLIHFLGFRIMATPFAKDQLMERKQFKTADIQTIFNGVDLDFIQQITPSRKMYDACFLGGLIGKKGIFDLVDIWEIVCQKIPRAQLAIIGTGFQKNQLEKEVKNRNLQKNCAILGYLSEEEKYATLKASRLFVYPSREESWGISVAEALACGLPVVVYNLPAYKHLGDSVIRVSLGDKGRIAEQVLSLMVSEDLIGKIQEKNRNISSKFDWNIVARDVYETYRKIIDQKL